MEASEPRVRITGDVRGQVVVGDHNIVVSAEQSVVTIVKPGQRPECRPRPRRQLLPRRVRDAVGRTEELAAIAEGTETGGPVQVHGASGLGKSTLLRMAAHRLAERRDDVVFVGAAGRDPGDVLQDVFEACYDAPGYRPGPVQLRQLLSAVPMGLVVDDLECESAELSEVLDTVGEATVLYSATERTLWGEGRAIRLRGLGRDDAAALLSRQLGRPLRAGEQPVAEALWQATEGSPRQLLLAVTETGLRPPAELGDVLPGLLGGLTGAEQRIVTLLGLAGQAGVSTGLLSELAPAPDGTEEALERLVTMGVAAPTAYGYRLPADVGTALPRQQHLRPDPEAVTALCDRLRTWVDGPGRTPAEVAADGPLIVAAVDTAAAAGSDAARAAARLAHAAAPAVACSLRLGVWGRLLESGRTAAERAREQGILAYLTHEDGIRRLVTGKRVAAAVAFAAAAELWRLLGDSGHAAGSHGAGRLCTPDPTTTHAAAHSGGASSHAAGATPDPSGGLTSAPPADPGTTAAAAKGAGGLTAKLAIGGGLAAVTATGAILGYQAMKPETVPVRVTVTTSVMEVTMPGKQEAGCRIKGGATDCTTVVTSKKGERGPVSVDPAAPLPAGVSIVYWGCDQGPEAASCTVSADQAKTICVSTTSPADKQDRDACAKATHSPAPLLRTEAVTVVAVDAQGKPRPGWTVEQSEGSGDPLIGGCATSPASVGTDIVQCGASADSANVCWVAADRLSVLCGDFPWDRKLVRHTLSEPATAAPAATDPVPWGIELADGTRCRLRSGGAWQAYPDDMVGAYWCVDSTIVIAQKLDGPVLDKSAPGWTVQVFDDDAVAKGDKTIPPRQKIAKVWYAGSD